MVTHPAQGGRADHCPYDRARFGPKDEAALQTVAVRRARVASEEHPPDVVLVRAQVDVPKLLPSGDARPPENRQMEQLKRCVIEAIHDNPAFAGWDRIWQHAL